MTITLYCFPRCSVFFGCFKELKAKRTLRSTQPKNLSVGATSGFVSATSTTSRAKLNSRHELEIRFRMET